MADMKKEYRKYPIIFIVIGVLGLLFTSISLLMIYKNANNAKELTMPLVYNFIPFVISFFLFKKGINDLINRKK
jgi:uncharacterized protein YacL